MTGEIKFRVWDKKLGKYVDPERVYLAGNGTLRTWGDAPLDRDRFDIEFSTTLRDKNGVEICKGDILKYVSPEPQDDDRPDLYVVEWKGFGWEATWQHSHKPTYTSDGRLSLQGVDEDMEVIGNIYENPELLEHSS